MEFLKRHEKLLVNLLLGLLAVVFAIGIWAPILTLKKLLIVQNTFSILSGVTQLARDGQYGLFSLLTAFTLVLPCLKIGVLFAAWNSRPKQAHFLAWLSTLGKWSMLDVFVVAMLIASVKLGALATIEVHYGLYVFAAAVVLMIFNTNFVSKRLDSASG